MFSPGVIIFSTLSSFINSLSAVCVEDFLKPFCKKYKKKTLTEKEGKTWCMIFGELCNIVARKIQDGRQTLNCYNVRGDRSRLMLLVSTIGFLGTIGLHTCLTIRAVSQEISIFSHLKMCLATAIHNFK